MDDKFKDIPKIIKRLRVDSGLTQKQLGEIISCAGYRVSRLENKKDHISVSEWLQFCDYFQIPLETFYIPNLLLVNNSISERKEIREMLCEHKAFLNFFEARNSQEALRIISNNKINLTIINIKTSKMRELKLVEKIKENREKNMPVILTTSNGPASKRDVMDLKIIRIIKRPFTKQQLIYAIPAYLFIKRS